MNKPIFHLAHSADIDMMEQSGIYSAPSLKTEGFIHCCTDDQLPGVIQRYYMDTTELVVLHINAQWLTNSLVYENTSGGTELFPHVYGEINATAVVHTLMIDQSDIARIAASQRYQYQP